ncbi:MAG TPA: hypothetical protein VFV38_28645, partial [Ktedonobacteraceae bacterium]|nr:hypothetical protein [Ktedonobacteraceae bacterium]
MENGWLGTVPTPPSEGGSASVSPVQMNPSASPGTRRFFDDANLSRSPLPNPTHRPPHKRFFARWVLPIALITLFLLIVGAWLGTKLWSNTTQTDNAVSAPKDIASNYGVINLPLRDLALSDSLQGNAHSQLLINGQVQVRNGLVLFPSDTPTMPQAGELYYSQSTNQPYYYDGKQFVSIKPTTEGVRAIGSLTGNVALGAGLRVVGGQLDTVLQAGINDITGTPDQVLVSSTNGQVVLALPQAIAPSSDPTFAGLHIASSIAAGSLALGTGTTTTGSLAFHNAATSSVLTLQSGATASDLVFTLPTTDGTSGQCLSTDGHGQLSFTSCASGAGSGVTQLNGLTGALTIANASTAGSVITINDASTSQKGIAQFDPTNFLASSGVITTVQNISPSSGPTFAGLTLTAPLAVASGGTGATTAANARTNLGAAASGINADITATTALNTVTPSGALTLGAPGQHFLLQGNTSSTLVATNGVFTTTLAFANPTADVTLSVPALSTGSYAFCTTSGNCAGAGGGVTTPGGTAGQLATFTGSQTLANSIIRDDGSTIAISGAAVIQGAGGVTVGVGSTTTGKVAFANATNTNIFTLQSGATASSFTLTLPTADGAAGQCLSTDGSGVLNFHDCLSGSGAGGGVSSLNSLVGALTIANATGTSSTITINDASTVQKGIAQFDATNFSVSSGTVTTIQDIATTSSPTFASLTLSSPLTVANGGTGATTASGARSNLGAAASGANSDITALAGLTTALSVAQGGTGATTASGARSSLGAAASGTNADITATTALNTITPTGALTIGAPSQHLTLQGNGSSILTSSNGTFTTTIGFTDPIANTTLNFPALSAGTYMVCTTNGNCAGVAGGVTTSGGTIGKLAKFTGSQVLGDSILSEIGSTFTIAGSEVIQGAGGLTIGVASSANGKVVFQNATNAHTLALQSGTTASDLTLTLPTADGSSGQCLSTNGSGVLSFQPCLTGAGANGGVSSLDTLVGALTIANSSSAGSTITLDNASTSQKGIAQFNATNFAASAGTINTIQDIALTSSPTFAGLNVTGNTGIVVGTSTTLGTLTLRDGNTGAHGVTLQVQQPLTSNQTLTIPDATGTLCLQNAASCGFAAASGSSSYIQNQISSPQSAASYWISGTGRADTSVLTPLLDTATATGLNIGTTNATGINLNQNTALSAGKNLTFAAGAGNFDQSASTGTFATGSGSVSLNGNTTIAANKSLIANGAVTFTNATNTTTAFQVQDASTTTVLDVDTTNGRVGIGTTSPNAKLAITDLGFSDTFNRADSSSLGSNWTKRTDAGSDFQIVSNQLKLTSSDNSSNALSAYTSQGISSADYSVQADIVFPSSSDDWLSVFGRGSTFGTNDSQGYYAFASIGNQKIALYKRVAGTFTQVGASAFVTITAGTTYTIKLAMQGNSLSLYWNGQLATSTTDSTFSSAGFAGVALGQPNLVNSIWDNFSITPFTPTMNINNNLVVTANGQLGVGTNSPSYAIDVQGGNSINATG